MPGAAIVAAALTDHSAHPYSLYIDNVDYIRPRSALGNTYGVGIESVHVMEAAPGAVSAMTFTMDDPNNELAVGVQFAIGSIVRFENNTTGDPEFLGFFTTPAFVTDMGTGKHIGVQCIGVEILLDWSRWITDYTYTSGPVAAEAVQAVCAGAQWGGPVPSSLGVGTFATIDGGNVTQTIGAAKTLQIPATPLNIAANTVRAMITDIFNRAIVQGPTVLGTPGCYMVLTIDFRNRVRWFVTRPLAWDGPSDWVTMAVKNIPHANTYEYLQHTIDGGAVARGVYIVGGNAAGTGLVTDGTGLPGSIDTVTATNLLSNGDRDAFGASYLATKVEHPQGTFEELDWSPPAGLKCGGQVQLSDTILGLVLISYNTGAIDRTYNPSGRQNVRVTYGKVAPSFVDQN